MVIALTLILFTLGTIIAAAGTDFLKLRIPNIIPLIVILGFGVTWVTHSALNLEIFEQSLVSHLIVGGSMLVIMVILFFLKLFGGGDAKLIPAVTLWIGLKGLPAFLLITTIVGGCLAVLSIILRKTTLGQKLLTKLLHNPKLQDGWVAALAKGDNVVPYGIAIAIGAIMSFRDVGLLP